MGPKYLTDGVHLYEIAAQRTVQNYGLGRGTIRYTILRDCVTETVANMGELDLAALTEVTVSGGGGLV
jgi:hypothetical protein